MLRVCGLLRFQGCGLREFRVLQGLIFVCGFQVFAGPFGVLRRLKPRHAAFLLRN